MIKIIAPRMLCTITDKAMQMFGGKGLTNDTPIMDFYSWGRVIRLADGPDEVHMYQLGRNLINQYLDEVD